MKTRGKAGGKKPAVKKVDASKVKAALNEKAKKSGRAKKSSGKKMSAAQVKAALNKIINEMD